MHAHPDVNILFEHDKEVRRGESVHDLPEVAPPQWPLYCDYFPEQNPKAEDVCFVRHFACKQSHHFQKLPSKPT